MEVKCESRDCNRYLTGEEQSSIPLGNPKLVKGRYCAHCIFLINENRLSCERRKNE